MNLTGGWHWHWRAWRSQRRWAATSAHIANWLMAQTIPQRELVLIGASAGWMLPTAWLARFDDIHHWDIDPWAGRLFRWRHGAALHRQGTTLHTHHGDAIALLPQILRQHPQAFFWFDNVLGQLRFGTPDLNALQKQLRQWRHTLHNKAWGSVHDRMSGPVHTRTHGIPSAHTAMAGLPMEATPTQTWLQSMGAISPWLDHLTEDVLPAGTPVLHLAWPFKPGYVHWLEMGVCIPPQT